MTAEGAARTTRATPSASLHNQPRYFFSGVIFSA